MGSQAGFCLMYWGLKWRAEHTLRHVCDISNTFIWRASPGVFFFLIAASEPSPPTGIQLWSLSAADVWTCHSRKFRSIIILLTKGSFPGICAVQLVKSRTASVFDRSECEKPSFLFKRHLSFSNFWVKDAIVFQMIATLRVVITPAYLTSCNKLYKLLWEVTQVSGVEKQLLFLRLWQKSVKLFYKFWHRIQLPRGKNIQTLSKTSVLKQPEMTCCQ